MVLLTNTAHPIRAILLAKATTALLNPRAALTLLIQRLRRSFFFAARITTDRVAQGYRGNPLGFPTFILGGAFLSTIIGSLQGFVISAVDSTIGRVVLVAVLFGIMVAASWALLRGAGIARRRIRLTTEQPMQALYQTIGRCGDPPQDHARLFALIALILMAVAWVTIPVALGVSLLTD